MSSRRTTRRGLLAGAGAVGALTVTGLGLEVVRGDHDWIERESPTGSTLYDAASAGGTAFAVGGDGLLERTADGWRLVDGDGLLGSNTTLRGVAATDDDAALWVAGSEGAVGAYDPVDGTLDRFDLGDLLGLGRTLYDVSVVGSRGDERVYASTTDGDVVVGRQGLAGRQWTTVGTGGGQTLTGVDFHSDSTGYAVGRGGTVFRSTDGGDSWRAVGVPGFDTVLYDVVSGPDRVYVAAENGRLFRLDCTCALWTPVAAGAKGVRALAANADGLLGAGENSRAFEFVEDRWTAHDTSAGATLSGVARGPVDVAVGSGGAIVER
jgi:photosystem II stability/assembly factor-like uncharacterized protein